jgi:hypothetical protein
MSVYRDLQSFVESHTACGAGSICAESAQAEGSSFLVRVCCDCGSSFERSVSPTDACYLLILTGGAPALN